VEGWREPSSSCPSLCLAEFVRRDVVAGGSDEARGEDDSGIAVCEDEGRRMGGIRGVLLFSESLGCCCVRAWRSRTWRLGRTLLANDVGYGL
jgi:hypothetical protein